MSSNIFTMVFFSIGILTTIKFIIKIIIELRAYWLEGNFKTRRECLCDFFYRKIRNEPVIVYNNSFNYYNYDQDYDYDYDYDDYEYDHDEAYYDSYKQETNALSYADIEKAEDEIEITMYQFKNIKAAQACCKKLNQGDRYIYNIKGKVYALVEATVSEEEMVKYGAITIDDEQKYDVFLEIVDYDTRCFEFLDDETASFITNRFSGGRKINYLGHVFVDFSGKSDEEIIKIRDLAAECFGLEVSDKFLVEKLKNIK